MSSRTYHGSLPVGDYSTAVQLYSTAVNAGASQTNALYLVGSAYQESSFNPALRGSDGGTSSGLMQVGNAFYNQMQRQGITDPAGQMRAYISQLQRVAPDTWAAMNDASTVQDVYAAQYADPNFRMGIPGARFDYANQISSLIGPAGNPFDQAFQNWQPQGSPTDFAAGQSPEMFVNPADFWSGVQTQSPGVGPNDFTSYQPPSFDQFFGGPADYGGARPGFADLSSVVPPGAFPSFSPPTNENIGPSETGFAPADWTGADGTFGGPASQNNFTPYVPFTDFSNNWQGYDPIVQSPFWNNDISNFANINIGEDLPLSPNVMSSPGEVTDNPFADASWGPAGPPSEDYGFQVDNPFADPSWLPDSGALTDWQAAVNQFGEGGFGYDAQGNIVPWGMDSGGPSSVAAGVPPAYDPLAQGSIGQPGGVSTVKGTVVLQNGNYGRFDPATGGYFDTGIPAAGSGALGTGFTGGFGVGAGPSFGVTPAGFSTGYTPFGGGGVGPQFSPGGQFLGGGVFMLPSGQMVTRIDPGAPGRGDPQGSGGVAGLGGALSLKIDAPSPGVRSATAVGKRGG